MTKVGTTIKELEDLQLGTLFTIQNNSTFLLDKGVFIQAGGRSTYEWWWKN